LPKNQQQLSGLGGMGKLKDNMKMKEKELSSNIKSDSSIQDLVKLSETIKGSLKELKGK